MMTKKYSWAKISPSDSMEFSFSINFNSKAIFKQSCEVVLDKKTYLEKNIKSKNFRTYERYE